MAGSNAQFAAAWSAADTAGKAAAEACVPRPMVVRQHTNPLYDGSAVTKEWFVADGVCGFAWVVFKGNSAFGRWAKANKRVGKHYPTGLSYWVGDYGQSMAKKEAYARAFARSLNDAGIDAYADSRID